MSPTILRTRRLVLATAVALAAFAFMLTPTAGAAKGFADTGSETRRSDDRGLPLAVRKTLRANPGSSLVSAHEILLEPGVLLSFPSASDKAQRTAAAADCPRQGFCLYEHTSYRGARIAFFTCFDYNLKFERFWNTTNGGWDDWAGDASSWHNNQTGGAVAQVFMGNATYYAGIGASPNFGRWNDYAVGVRPCW